MYFFLQTQFHSKIIILILDFLVIIFDLNRFSYIKKEKNANFLLIFLNYCCFPDKNRYNIFILEVWLSLVERCVRDAKAAGSNPVTSTRYEESRLNVDFSRFKRLFHYIFPIKNG